MERGPRPARPILSREPSRRQQRSRKVPEPLRRAIAECTQPHAAPLETAACHPVRTLEDYLGDAATVDMAYNALLDHAMVEKGRSPHVIMKVVALLKKYLFRYHSPLLTHPSSSSRLLLFSPSRYHHLILSFSSLACTRATATCSFRPRICVSSPTLLPPSFLPNLTNPSLRFSHLYFLLTTLPHPPLPHMPLAATPPSCPPLPDLMPPPSTLQLRPGDFKSGAHRRLPCGHHSRFSNRIKRTAYPLPPPPSPLLPPLSSLPLSPSSLPPPPSPFPPLPSPALQLRPGNIHIGAHRRLLCGRDSGA
ncbi:unnamed protein product [Closterium sp. Naga37s-1]|nr:unnamed protein product [Closterium sp. Naga37s-1]